MMAAERWRLRPWGWPPVLVALATVAAFLPSLQNGFVNWDDPDSFVHNPHYRGLGLAQLGWMFATSHLNQYSPLVWLSFGADYLLWGMDPTGYHLTSLVFHAAAAVALFFVTRKLLCFAAREPVQTADAGVWIASAFAALLFAVHPLRVEAVAWASARRDVLSGLLLLLTVLAYLRAYEAGGDSCARRRWLAASVGVFVLALLSKATVMTLPLVLLALDVYPLRRFPPHARGLWAEKVPFVVLAAAGAAVALAVELRETALAPLVDHGIAARLAVAVYGVMFYVAKSLAPIGLSPFYPLPVPLDPLAPRFLAAGAGVVLITAAMVAVRGRLPAVAAAWAIYVIMSAPMLGLTQRGEQIVADRYSYLSCLAWPVLAGAGLLGLWRAGERGRAGRALLASGIIGAGLIVAALGALTWRQVFVWRDSISLWTHALRVVPDAHLAHHQLGNALLREGRVNEAIAHYRRSLEIRPLQPLAYSNLARALASQDKTAEAIAYYRVSLGMDTAQADTHYRLGNLLLGQRALEAAADHFRRAVAISPGFAEAHNNLGVALAEQGRPADAIASYREALRLQPTNANAHNNLGNALLAQGRVGEAVNAYQQALRLAPGYPSAHFGLGLAYLELRDRSAALHEYRNLRTLDQGLAGRLLDLINRR